MHKKQYNKLAALIAREVDEFPYDPSNILSMVTLARKLCPLFKKHNPLFDRKRFLRACAVDGYAITQLKRDIKDQNEFYESIR
jgi:hypothetical protein